MILATQPQLNSLPKKIRPPTLTRAWQNNSISRRRPRQVSHRYASGSQLTCTSQLPAFIAQHGHMALVSRQDLMANVFDNQSREVLESSGLNSVACVTSQLPLLFLPLSSWLRQFLWLSSAVNLSSTNLLACRTSWTGLMKARISATIPKTLSLRITTGNVWRDGMSPQDVRKR